MSRDLGLLAHLHPFVTPSQSPNFWRPVVNHDVSPVYSRWAAPGLNRIPFRSSRCSERKNGQKKSLVENRLRIAPWLLGPYDVSIPLKTITRRIERFTRQVF